MMQQPIRHHAGPIYFLAACALYLVGVTYLDATGIAYLGIISVNIALLTGLSKGIMARTGNMMPLFLIMAAVATFNMLATTARQETALRWIVWFEMFIAFGWLATECEESVDRSLAALLPFGTAWIWFAKYRAAGAADATPAEIESDLHLSAFFASLTIACGLFHPRMFWRCSFAVIGVCGVLASGSRAAFIFLPLLFIVPCLYYFKSRASAIAAALIPAALLVAGIFLSDSFRDATFGRKAVVIGRDAVEDAMQSLDDRGYLRELAFEMIKARPLGYGYGNTYSIPGAGNKLRGTNFHNGYLNVGAAMGLPFLVLYIWFNAWLLWSLYSDRRTPRLFRHLFLAVLVCANLRALTEDFTLFDLGNPICYLVIYLTFLYLNKRRYTPVFAAA